MKTKSKTIIILLLSIVTVCFGILLFTSCAEPKKLNIDDKSVVVEPYGWMNEDAQKLDNVIYQISPGTIIFSVIFCETIVVPIYLTGTQLYEPVKVIENPKK